MKDNGWCEIIILSPFLIASSTTASVTSSASKIPVSLRLHHPLLDQHYHMIPVRLLETRFNAVYNITNVPYAG